jgi:hypothetical protein
MKRPAFQRRQYARIADVIRRTRLLPHDSAEEAWTDLVENLADAFAADNGEFERGAFKRAADPSHVNGERP